MEVELNPRALVPKLPMIATTQNSLPEEGGPWKLGLVRIYCNKKALGISGRGEEGTGKRVSLFLGAGAGRKHNGRTVEISRSVLAPCLKPVHHGQCQATPEFLGAFRCSSFSFIHPQVQFIYSGPFGSHHVIETQVTTQMVGLLWQGARYSGLGPAAT